MWNKPGRKTVKICISARGFSMIELMVVLAISSILMTVAAPSMLSAYQQYTVTSQANELVSALTYARSEAIRRNTSVRFCRVASDTATNCETYSGSWKYWIISANNAVISRGFIKTQAGLDQTSNVQSLTFRANGMAYNNQELLTSSYIQLKAGEQIRCISLESGSRTRVTKPEHNSNTTDEDDEDSGDSCSS